ncbi:hypothetical protein DL93DRAFT_2076653 [Clavulina sp. PMI_390]|nr:hypothetical protein DL93DRAFT_2076653 [Clavulina sp. PMI_390]
MPVANNQAQSSTLGGYNPYGPAAVGAEHVSHDPSYTYPSGVYNAPPGPPPSGYGGYSGNSSNPHSTAPIESS